MVNEPVDSGQRHGRVGRADSAVAFASGGKRTFAAFQMKVFYGSPTTQIFLPRYSIVKRAHVKCSDACQKQIVYHSIFLAIRR